MSIADFEPSGSNVGLTEQSVEYQAYNSGDLLIQIFGTDGDATHTPPGTGPNGETIGSVVTDANTGDAAGPHLSVVYWVATSTEAAGTLTWSLSVGEQFGAICLRVAGGDFDPADPIAAVSAVGFSTGNATSADTPSFEVVPSGALVVAAGAVDTDDIGSPFSPTGWTDIFTEDIGEISSFASVRDALTSASETVGAASFGSFSDTYVALAFAIRPASAGGATGRGRLVGGKLAGGNLLVRMH